jgi:hypothetical protein
MSPWRSFPLLASLLCCLALAPPAAAQSASQCTLLDTFRSLHDAAPSEVGECRGGQIDEDNGDASQATNKGLLLWRKADNWTVFIGPSRTLILGPEGPTRRANTERFAWELNGFTPEAGMFGDPASGLLPPAALGFGFEMADSNINEMSASATLFRTGQDRFSASRTIVQTIQLLPSPELAHTLFLDLGNLQQSDGVLKTTQLGDETQVLTWKPDDPSSYSATFRQLALRSRRSNAVVTIVLVPGTRLDFAVQLASMTFGRLR